MRLAELSLELFRKGLAIYGDVAFAGSDQRQLPDFPGEPSTSVESVLDRFLDETPEHRAARRYALRLGNSRYPFMKLAIVEFLIRGEFFLAVDTHDQMFEQSSDQGELLELQRFNREVKQHIEERWLSEGLPTMAHLRGMLEANPPPQQPARGQRVLVVDDEPQAADTLALLLESRGFDVELASDGAEAVARADPGRHSVILMDCDMPVMNGLEATRRLKEGTGTRSIPILLATAGSLDLADVHPADAFLVKPFQAEILFSFLDHLLRGSDPGEPAS